MKLHLPVLLRKALLACFSFAFASSMGSGSAAAADLSLGSEDALTIDYADATSIRDLENGTLQLNGDTILLLSNCGSGDGKTYTLLTGVSGLLDAAGNELSLDASNNAISSYFDTTQPGTGFWSEATLVLTPDGFLQLVRHNETVKAVQDITTRQTSNLEYNYYEGISFKDIAYSNSSSDYGGAISGGSNSTITLSNNGSVTFSGNKASSGSDDADDGAFGGAIYGDSSIITLSDNGSVVFEGNTASSTSSDAFGGAIEVWYNCTVTLSNNDSVEFIGNSASASSPTYSAARGGAIHGYSGTITLSDNGSVVFEGNTTSSTSSYANGGAIYGDSSIITLSDNGSVVFEGNTASSTSSYASRDHASGGAIDGGAITLSNNGSVTFSGNTVSSSGLRVYGGAICGYTITLSDNGSVTFSGNTASGDYAHGGAIYISGSLHIRNNDSVEFAGNVEKEGSAYRLRSVYVYGVSDDVLNISAAAGKTVSFHDSIYVGSDATVNLNADYEDAEGNIIEQKGDIIFSGATTEDDLYKAKGNVDGTEEEIRLSRTSEVLITANLYNGRLIIKEGAIWSGAGITVDPVAGATGKPTLLLQNGTLTHDASSVTNRNVVTIKSGGAFEVAGKSQADYTSLVLEGGSSWIFNIGSDNTAADSAVLSMENSSLTLPGSGKVTLQLNAATGVGNGKAYALLSGIEQPTDWSADSITVISGTTGWNVGFSDLTWADNTLWLYYDARPALVTATWTNESGDGKWNTTSVNWEQNEIDFSYNNGVAVVFDGQGAGTVELVGELAPGSVLVNNAAGQDYTFGGNGSLAGDMKLTKKGAGNLTISTANSYSGGTVVNGGSLLAGHDKAFGSGDVTVNDATLDLNRFTIANKVRLNGNSTLGHADGASHIVLGGGSKVHFRDGYTLGSGKNLEVAALGAAYTGALTLGGGTLKLDGLLTVQGDVVFSAGTQTTIDLSGWNGVADGDVLATLGSSNSGYTEDSLTLSGIAGDWELDFDAADGTLTLVAVRDTPLPNPVFRPNLTRNQRATYGALKAIMAGGAPEGLLGELGREVVSTRDESKLKKLLNEMSGEEYTTMMSSQIEGNLAHLRRLRAAVGHATPQYGIGFYANAFHHDADVNSDAAGMGYQRSEWGAHFGVEGHIEKNTIWGLGLEKSRARVTPDGVARYHEDATRLDAYVRYEDGGWRIMGAFGMGEHRYDLHRRFSNGVAAEAENLDGSSVNMMAELAYSLHLAEQHTLQPFFVVESSYNKIDAFEEEGAGSASLRGADRTAWATDVTLGVRYVYGFAAVSGAPAASLTLHSGVVGSVGDTTADLNLRFCGADTQYVQRGADNNRWGYNVGMNVFVPLNDTMSVFGSAESILRGDTTQFDAQIGVRVAF